MEQFGEDMKIKQSVKMVAQKENDARYNVFYITKDGVNVNLEGLSYTDALDLVHNTLDNSNEKKGTTTVTTEFTEFTESPIIECAVFKPFTNTFTTWQEKMKENHVLIIHDVIPILEGCDIQGTQTKEVNGVDVNSAFDYEIMVTYSIKAKD